MILSMTAEYALRAMAEIAARGPEPVRARDLSQTAGVPAAYLPKILRRLAAAGLLASEKGHGGGFRLTRGAAKITFGEVLRAVDVDLEHGGCVFGWGACDSRLPCLLHPAWAELKTQLSHWARESTLAHATSGAAAVKHFQRAWRHAAAKGPAPAEGRR